ncbi:N-acetylgalactosamine 6-sulfate sulfatase [Planctomycetales bacterium 10988]|nr:N-acetylgalactosamine 6-sulfate sulfatase [Planctomycetales bacterium 10988]
MNLSYLLYIALKNLTHDQKFCLILLCCLTCLPLPLLVQAEVEKPNVIVILTDDQGYADVGFHHLPAGEDVLTPNLDRLAASGIVFRNGYVAFSTCGPSRSSLLTGRSSSRFGIEDNGTWPNGDTGPPTDEIILPRLLKPLGYQSGAFGKWHLGESEGMLPLDRGFDYYWGDIPKHKDYFMRHLPQPPCWNPPKPQEECYLTDAITDEAVAFIKRNQEQTFFAYVAYNAPHSPFRTTESLVKRIVEHQPKFQSAYKRMQQQKKFPRYDFGRFKGTDLDMEILRLVYCSMLLSVDDGVGKILATLDELEIRENTLIFYLSDNGAALARPNDLGGVNLPLRSGKGSVYDGGVRVPYVMSWPGTLTPARNEDMLVSSMDIFSTTLELAGGVLPQDRKIDGVNLIPYLTDEKEGRPHKYLFFRRQDRNAWALRHGRYKWVWNPGKKAHLRSENPALMPESNSEGGLYDIQHDWTEWNDLSEEQPEVKERLKRLYKKFTKDFPPPMSSSSPGQDK